MKKLLSEQHIMMNICHMTAAAGRCNDEKAGINTVRIAESTWSTCEPQEGVFDFSMWNVLWTQWKKRDQCDHWNSYICDPYMDGEIHPDVWQKP